MSGHNFPFSSLPYAATHDPKIYRLNAVAADLNSDLHKESFFPDIVLVVLARC